MRLPIDYFQSLRDKGLKGFVPYLVAGYPGRSWTERLMMATAEAGATAIELGVPFSDPIADGPVLQKASFLALEQGITLDDILAMAGNITDRIGIPVLLMGYTNPFLQKGWNRLLRQAGSAGVSGFIVADLPVEEAETLSRSCRDAGLSLNLLCAPTTSPTRMRAISRSCTGFVYLVSVKGVTGARESLSGHLDKFVREARARIRNPIYVGFGISSPQHAREVSRFADGVIVGSRIATFLEEHAGRPDLDASLRSFLRPWAEAVQNPGRQPAHAPG